MKIQHTDYSTNPLFNAAALPKETTFKISGTPLELVQALAYIRALGGGHLYIGLKLLEPKHLYYRGQYAPPELKDRLNQQDFDDFCELVQNCSYLRSVNTWAGEQVDYDLDKIDYATDMDNRFNMAPMDRFGKVLNVHWTQWPAVRANSWLDIPAIPGRPQGKGLVVAGSGWKPREAYSQWRSQNIGSAAVFVGSAKDYAEWLAVTNIKMTLIKTDSVGELAQWISGMNQVITTPNSWAVPIAQALNKSYLVQSSPDLQLWNNPNVLAERGNNSVF